MIKSVPFVNYPRQYKAIKPEIDEAMQRCLSNGDLIYRKDLIDFENNFAQLHGCKYGISTGSCTGAMFIALKALGIGPGDEVITVAHTYVATVDVIKACGATPILVDVNKSDMLMDMNHVADSITQKTRCVMPVHLNGAMCNMGGLKNLQNDYDFAILEDAAQSPMAQRDGIMPGQMSDVACFSFYPAKVLGSYGEGGMAITNDWDIARELYLLRDHGEFPVYKMMYTKRNHLIQGWGYNTILDNITAAVLNVKMKYLKGWIKRRKEISGIYVKSSLGDLYPKFICPQMTHYRNFSHVYDVWQNYVIRTENRDALQKHLESKGIETLVSWRIPLHKQPALMQELGHFHLPVTEEISRTCLSLPMYPELTDDEVNYVIESVRSFFE